MAERKRLGEYAQELVHLLSKLVLEAVVQASLTLYTPSHFTLVLKYVVYQE